MPSSIHPLNTVYRGFRFRSRLEARWAIFFDAIGIQFEYETQGFKLSSGECYLPDFYIPHVRMYAEIKPSDEAIFMPEIDRCGQFVSSGLCSSLLFIVGPPDFRPYLGIHRAITEGGNEHFTTNVILDIHQAPKIYEVERRFFFDFPDDEFPDESYFSEQYRDAVYASRYERF